MPPIKSKKYFSTLSTLTKHLVRAQQTLFYQVWPRTTSMSPFARGRAHDHGTAAMSSVARSVRGRKKRIAPMALYTNYNGHVLNLSVAAARRLTPVTEA